MTVRKAGESKAVEQLLLADKYRYLGAEDFPATEARVVHEDLEELLHFLEGGEEYQQALMGDSIYGQRLWGTPEDVEAKYEESVKMRLAELRKVLPGATFDALLQRVL